MAHARLPSFARLLLIGLAALAGCSSAPPPAAEGAPSPSSTEAPEAPPAAEAPAPTSTPAAMGTVVRREGDAIPEDVVLTPRDCAELGKVYGEVQRSDQRANLPAKLSAKQREQVEENINRVVDKIVNQWVESCMNQLAGKNVDPKSLKCVNRAKTVKDFDVCLNGEPPPAAAPEKTK